MSPTDPEHLQGEMSGSGEENVALAELGLRPKDCSLSWQIRQNNRSEKFEEATAGDLTKLSRI